MWEWILAAVAWVTSNYGGAIIAVDGLLVALIAIFMLVPGEQPEKFMQWMLDQLKKFSLDKK